MNDYNFSTHKRLFRSLLMYCMYFMFILVHAYIYFPTGVSLNTKPRNHFFFLYFWVICCKVYYLLHILYFTIRGAICLPLLVGLSISVRKRGKEEKGKRRKREKGKRRKREKEKRRKRGKGEKKKMRKVERRKGEKGKRRKGEKGKRRKEE